MTFRRRLLTAIGMTLVAIAGQSAQAAACDSKCLRLQMDVYLAALLQHDASRLSVAPTVRYTENGQVLELGKGLWEKASSVGTYTHYVVDPISQQVVFLGIVMEADAPAIVSLRLAIKEQMIVEAEHIVARKGSHALFAPEALRQPNPLLATKIPAAERSSREAMIAIADSYFEGIQQHSSQLVKADDNCQRIENGVPTTNQPGRGSRNCQQSADLLTYIKSVDERRFPIVDVATGIVFAAITFDIPGEASSANDSTIAPNAQIAARLRQPRTLLLSEWFKIEGGLITHIEAVMHNLPRGFKSGWDAGQ